MEYIKIKIGYILDEDRFYRTFLVNENINLKAFGCAILTSLYSTFENDYYFSCGIVRYLPEYLIRKYYENEDKLISNHLVKDLNDEFDFYYGLDEYGFTGIKLAKVEIDSDKEVILIDGAGLGIWENNVHTLNSYLLGKLEPNSLEVDYFEDIYPPTNVKIEKYGDFDTNFKLENIKACFDELYQLRLHNLDNNHKEEINNEITMIINYQINANAKIKNIYENLLTKYSKNEVILMMYAKFTQENITAITFNEEFNEERYLKALIELN